MTHTPTMSPPSFALSVPYLLCPTSHAGLAIAPPGMAVGLDVELLGRVPRRCDCCDSCDGCDACLAH